MRLGTKQNNLPALTAKRASNRLTTTGGSMISYRSTIARQKKRSLAAAQNSPAAHQGRTSLLSLTSPPTATDPQVRLLPTPRADTRLAPRLTSHRHSLGPRTKTITRPLAPVDTAIQTHGARHHSPAPSLTPPLAPPSPAFLQALQPPSPSPRRRHKVRSSRRTTRGQ